MKKTLYAVLLSTFATTVVLFCVLPVVAFGQKSEKIELKTKFGKISDEEITMKVMKKTQKPPPLFYLKKASFLGVVLMGLNTTRA
ncbi:MAG: hypothetical protein HC817_05610 [Saprospiraceae bacterium]|nr:hypothetical protein [Saprospiraceae bacterium]